MAQRTPSLDERLDAGACLGVRPDRGDATSVAGPLRSFRAVPGIGGAVGFAAAPIRVCPADGRVGICGRTGTNNTRRMDAMPKLIQIAPVVFPSSPTRLSEEAVVFALDEDGGLWKWDAAMKSIEWAPLCRLP